MFIIKNSSKGYKNSAVIEHQISMKLNFKGDTAGFRPVIKNFSSLQNNLIIKSIINDKAVNQKSLSLKPEQKNAIDIRYIINQTGYLGGYSEITDGDDLIQDNKNYFTLYVPDKINIGVKDHNNELFYVINAINPSYILNKNVKSYLNIREHDSIFAVSRNHLLILNYNRLNSLI